MGVEAMKGGIIMSARVLIGATSKPQLNMAPQHAHATAHQCSPLPPMPGLMLAVKMRIVHVLGGLQGPAGLGSGASQDLTIVSGGGSETWDASPDRPLNNKGGEDGAECGDGVSQAHVSMQEGIIVAAAHAIGAEGDIDGAEGITDAMNANGLLDTVVLVRSATAWRLKMVGPPFGWPGRHCGSADGDLGSHGGGDMGYAPSSSCLALTGKECVRRPWDHRRVDNRVTPLAMCASGA